MALLGSDHIIVTTHCAPAESTDSSTCTSTMIGRHILFQLIITILEATPYKVIHAETCRNVRINENYSGLAVSQLTSQRALTGGEEGAGQEVTLVDVAAVGGCAAAAQHDQARHQL